MKEKKKAVKPRTSKYGKKLAVNASFEDLVKITAKKTTDKRGS